MQQPATPGSAASAPDTLNLCIPPRWEEVELVRSRVMDFLARQGHSEDAVQSLGMVASELCENAVKYGFYPTGALGRIEVTLDVYSHEILVIVSCPLASGDSKHLQRFRQTLDWLQEHGDPREAYIQKMLEVADRDPHSKESGLGLPRIVYEGQSRLDYVIEKDQQLTVTATYTVGA